MHEGHYFVPPPYEGVTTMLRRKTLPTRQPGRWTRRDGRLILSTHLGSDEPAYDADNPILRGGQPVEEKAYLTDAFTREAADFIDRNSDRPFFLYLAFNAVHSPLQGADRWMKKFDHIEDVHRRIFAAMLASMDEGVGRVLDKLREEHLEENTLVFFISDNGGPTKELTSSNAPLRGGKGQTWEGGIRVPFLLQWKGTLPAGTEYHRPVISLDVFGTSADVAQAPLPKNRSIDGVSLLPFLLDTQPGDPHADLFWRLGRRAALRQGDWKIVRSPARRSPDPKWQLYNLADDISESNDLAGRQPEQLEKLVARFEQLNAHMIDPIWSPR